MKEPVDITGVKFGKLTVVSLGERDIKNRRWQWNCKCECGNSIVVFTRYLQRGSKTDCGCEVKRYPNKQKATAVWNKLFGSYKSNAKQRNLVMKLSFRQFKSLCQQNCWYCGTPPGRVFAYKSDESRNIIYNGVDRLFNEDDYTVQNSVPCCSYCNYLKREVDHIDFLAHIKAIAEHNLQMKSEPYDFESIFE